MPQIQATGGNSLSGNVNVQSKTSFTVSGAVVGITETSITIPAGTKAFKLQSAPSAGASVLTVSHTSTGTSTAATSFDICPGDRWTEELLDATGFTIYIKASKAATNVQLLLWS